MFDPENIIRDFAAHPERLADGLQTPLTFQEEILLKGLKNDLGERIGVVLQRVMAGSVEMYMSPEDKAYVRDLNGIRAAIHKILLTRGTQGAHFKSDN
jgi:hypothetical protein